MDIDDAGLTIGHLACATLLAPGEHVFGPSANMHDAGLLTEPRWVVDGPCNSSRRVLCHARWRVGSPDSAEGMS